MKTKKKRSKSRKQRMHESRTNRRLIACKKAYTERNDTLKRLGFTSYASYLASPLWKEIRARVLARKPKCEACPSTATEVHHGSYSESVLLGYDDTGLFSICRVCHIDIEFWRPSFKYKQKRDPKQATDILCDKIRRRNKVLVKQNGPIVVARDVVAGVIPPIECSRSTSDYAKRC